jgi:hypothetical protein
LPRRRLGRPATFRSPCGVIRSPRRCCSRPTSFPAASCHPLATPAVCPPRQLSGHHVSSARDTGTVPAPPTLPSPRVIRLPRRRFSHPANFPVTAVIRSPRCQCSRPTSFPVTARHPLPVPSLTPATRSPRRRCACPANIPVTACHPLDTPAPAPPTFRSPRVIRPLHRPLAQLPSGA